MPLNKLLLGPELRDSLGLDYPLMQVKNFAGDFILLTIASIFKRPSEN